MGRRRRSIQQVTYIPDDMAFKHDDVVVVDDFQSLFVLLLLLLFILRQLLVTGAGPIRDSVHTRQQSHT